MEICVDFKAPPRSSYFLFSYEQASWLKDKLPDAPYFDLLDAEVEFDLRTNPKIFCEEFGRYRLDHMMKFKPHSDVIVIETKVINLF